MNKLISIIVFFCFALNVSFAQVSLTTAVDFTVTDKSGNEYRLFDILDAGQHVLIDFFTHNCVPCCNTWGDVDQLYRHFGCNSDHLFVLSIEGVGNLAELETFEINCGDGNSEKPVIPAFEGGGAEVFELYQPGAYPTIILIAPDRTILEKDIWPFNYQIGESRMLNYEVEHALCLGPDDVDEISGVEEIKVTPNPASEFFTLEITCSESNRLNIEMINLTGQTVHQIENKVFDPGYSSIEVSANDLAASTYFVKITSEENIPYLTKLVISK